MILSCLLAGERVVGGIEEATGIGQPALSQQLAELRRADLVRTSRVAKHVLYRLADDGVAQCVRNIEAFFANPRSVTAGPRPATAAVPGPPLDGRTGAAVFARIT